MTATRVLLADDHQLLREGLRRSMTDAGFDVIGEASDGLQAVQMATVSMPDVVLMDVTMPNLNGIEACRQVVELNPDARVVMLTMHSDEETLANAIRAGATGYLTKDCSTREIAEAVRMAASGDTVLSPELARSMLAEVRRLAPASEEAENEERDSIVSRREEQVLQLIADGCSTPEVAEQMFISQRTVKNHLASIYQKLDARDRTQAVLQAVRMGIIRLN